MKHLHITVLLSIISGHIKICFFFNIELLFSETKKINLNDTYIFVYPQLHNHIISLVNKPMFLSGLTLINLINDIENI